MKFKYLLFVFLVTFISLFVTSEKVFSYTYCGLGETYDYFTDSCACSYGYVRSYLGCITEDQSCKNTYGYGSRATLGGRCECSSGYIMTGGRCESGITYCSNEYGFHAKFDNFSKSCKCNLGYIMYGNKCISPDEKCQIDFGYQAESTSAFYNELSGLSCQCKSGYLWNSSETSCIDADFRCTELIGGNSNYNSIFQQCACDSGYLIDRDTHMCTSEVDFCEELVGADSYYIGDYECACNYGYILSPEDETCISEEAFCEEQLGSNSHYIEDFKCGCNNYYVLDESSGQCMEEEQFCETYFGDYTEYVGNNNCGCLDGYHLGDYSCEKDLIPFSLTNGGGKFFIWLPIFALIYFVINKSLLVIERFQDKEK